MIPRLKSVHFESSSQNLTEIWTGFTFILIQSVIHSFKNGSPGLSLLITIAAADKRYF